uniref:Uncharacterized protein n=1 Tax=Anguilla anguilla TaxID=7936 RepID=A0A0E9UPL2_ANGAN
MYTVLFWCPICVSTPFSASYLS